MALVQFRTSNRTISSMNTPIIPSAELISSFRASFDDLASIHHQHMVLKGFWDSPRTDSELIVQIHGEVSEIWDALRHGNPPDDKVPQFSGAEAEAADTILRLMDACHRRGWRVTEALVAKMQYNLSRPYKHGKKF